MFVGKILLNEKVVILLNLLENIRGLDVQHAGTVNDVHSFVRGEVF